MGQPNSAERTRPRLVTIPISHYGERARWALDYAGIDYDEEHHVQMFSWIAAMRHGRRKFLPVLLVDGRVLNDSRIILHWCSDRAQISLFPSSASGRAEVEALSDDLAGAFGVASRLNGYEWFFRALEQTLPYNAGHAPSYQRELLRVAQRPVGRFASWYLGATAERAAEARGVIDRTMDQIAQRLADGRRFLFGDHFTAADLTFAAMSGPNLLPERYGTPLPPVDAAPSDAAERIRTWRSHPAGAFALRLYDQRPASRAHHVL